MKETTVLHWSDKLDLEVIKHCHMYGIDLFLFFQRKTFYIAAFLDIPEIANQLQTNYKYWRELDDQQTPSKATGDS